MLSWDLADYGFNLNLPKNQYKLYQFKSVYGDNDNLFTQIAIKFDPNSHQHYLITNLFKLANQYLHNDQKLILGGRAAAILTTAMLKNQDLSYDDISSYINDFDIYVPQRPSHFTSKYKEETYFYNTPIQLIYDIPAKKILTNVYFRFKNQLNNEYFVHNLVSTIDNYKKPIKDLPTDIIYTYDLNISQAAISMVKDQILYVVSEEFLNGIETETIAFTGRQKNWFDLFFFLQTKLPDLLNEPVLYKQLQNLAIHLNIVSKRLLKYYNTFPYAITAIDPNSLFLMKSLFETSINKGYLMVSHDSIWADVAKASSNQNNVFIQNNIVSDKILTLLDINPKSTF